MDCCELARLALWVIGGAFGVILILLIMFFGYSLRLDNRTVKLEKKNGHELEEIENLKQKVEKLTHEMSALPKKKCLTPH